MEITIFKEVTTEGVIASIEENSKKYHDGLYANMNNLPERTMVKKGAAEIGDIIKALKTSRIKLTKESTAKINKEHDAIVERLVIANKPFTDLIDAYNVERKVILDAEKALKQAIEEQVKFESDHEYALLLNNTFEYDRQQEIDAQTARDKQIADSAIAYAADQQKRLNEAQERDRVNQENARLANKEHVRKINSEALVDLVELGLTENNAKAVISAIAKQLISNIQINY
jgi:hypothetical protein